MKTPPLHKINILHLITGLNTGGAEKVVYDLSIHTDKKAFNIYVASLISEGEMMPQFRKAGISPYTCGLNKSIPGLINAIRKVRSIIIDNEIQVVHAHMFHALLIASIIKITTPHIKIIFTPHSVNLESKLREYITYLIKPFRYVDTVFSQKGSDNFYLKNPTFVANGISLKEFVKKDGDKTPKSRFQFICVGGLRPAKNYLEFLSKVLTKIDGKYNYHVQIAGEGTMRKEIEKSIIANNLSDRVSLLGLRSDIDELLNQSDVFLMPSAWEGLPIALLEAGMSSIPIIATPVGNIPSVINNETGYLEEITKFASTMEYVMEHFDEAVSRGISLRKNIIEHFSLESVVNKYENLYRLSLNSK